MMLKLNRIRYDSQGYSNETFYTKDQTPLRVKIINEGKTYLIINANTNLVLEEGSSKSAAVVLKKAKVALANRLGVSFEKEARPSRKGKKIGGLPRKEKV